MIDNATGIMISNLVDYTARRLCISREEAKAVVLDAAKVVCAQAPVPAKTYSVVRPPFAVLMSYGGTA